MELTQYDTANAISLIWGYNLPSDAKPGTNVDEFERAKRECISQLKIQLEQVKQIRDDVFFSKTANKHSRSLKLPEPNKAELSEAELSGERAYHSGIAYRENPFPREKTHQYLVNSWDNGWYQAATDDGHKWNTSKDGVERKKE